MTLFAGNNKYVGCESSIPRSTSRSHHAGKSTRDQPPGRVTKCAMCKRYRIDHNSAAQGRQHAEHEHAAGDRGCAGQARRANPAKSWLEDQRRRARVVRRVKDYVNVRRGLRGAECSSKGRAS